MLAVVGEVDADKIDTAFTRPVQSNVYNRPMKTGASAFYKGYSAGFQGIYNATDDHYGKERLDYREGYEKGSKDRIEGNQERYRYVSNTGAWPKPMGF